MNPLQIELSLGDSAGVSEPSFIGVGSDDGASQHFNLCARGRVIEDADGQTVPKGIEPADGFAGSGTRTATAASIDPVGGDHTLGSHAAAGSCNDGLRGTKPPATSSKTFWAFFQEPAAR